MSGTPPDPIFFDGPEDFRSWLQANHESETEVLVGFYKKATGKQTMSWPQAVDQALCFGWIDGKVNRIDDGRHPGGLRPPTPAASPQDTPQLLTDTLEAEGLMTPAGRRVFEARTAGKAGVYSFESDRPAELPAEYAERLSDAARDYYEGRPPWYRRTSAHWVTSAKREETKLKRLNTLIECSEQGLDVPPLRRP